MRNKLALAIVIVIALFAFTFPGVASAHASDATPNPWGYHFSNNHGGGMISVIITDPNKAVCNGRYFHCVRDFWRTPNGYVVQCRDGLLSHAGGVRGVCGRDRGVIKPLLQDFALCESMCQAEDGGYSNAEKALLAETAKVLYS